jgi:hypothetical protein
MTINLLSLETSNLEFINTNTIKLLQKVENICLLVSTEDAVLS